MPSSAGTPRRPPDPSSVTDWRTVMDDPREPWEKFAAATGSMGSSVPGVLSPQNVAGAENLADSSIGGGAVVGQVFNYGPDFEFVYDSLYADSGATIADPMAYFAGESDAWLEDEGFYDQGGPRGYTYNFDPNRTDGKGRTGTDANTLTGLDRSPAQITLAPTSSTFPKRPRTVAAGYDKKRKCLTVVFRDGTFYNYYGVGGLEWGNFKRARSKGRFIKQYLDGRVRGTADMGGISQGHQEILYRAARTVQVIEEGRQSGQKKGSKRGTGVGRYTYSSKNSASRYARKLRRGVERSINPGSF